MSEVIILRGISGSGKSTFIQQNILPYFQDRAAVVSTDFFMVDEEGRYSFHPLKLQEAHKRCLLQFVALVMEDFDHSPEAIIVDNTNTSLWEISPYTQLALAYGHRLEVVTLLCSPDIAFSRTQHQTPVHTVLSQDLRLRKSLLKVPPWWNQKIRFMT